MSNFLDALHNGYIGTKVLRTVSIPISNPPKTERKVVLSHEESNGPSFQIASSVEWKTSHTSFK